MHCILQSSRPAALPVDYRSNTHPPALLLGMLRPRGRSAAAPLRTEGCTSSFLAHHQQ